MSLQQLVAGYVKAIETTVLTPQEVVAIIHRFCQIKCIAIQNGSSTVKASVFDHETPSSCLVIPSIVGRPRPGSLYTGMFDGKDRYIGDEALAIRGVCSMTYPIKHGIVTNWDDVTHLWRHALHSHRSHANLDPADWTMLLTEKPRNPESNREKTAEIMFEELGVNGLCLVVDAVLSLLGTGRHTGIVLDIGDAVCQTVPIYEGRCVESAV